MPAAPRAYDGFQTSTVALIVDLEAFSQIKTKVGNYMKPVESLSRKLSIWATTLVNDVKGQDLIEYAMMAGFVAVAAAAVMPNITSSISTVFSKITSLMTAAAAS